MYSISAILFLFIGMTFNLAGSTSGKLKVCLISNEHTGDFIEETCNDVKNDALDCVRASDRLECLRVVSSGKADFALLESEDVFVSSGFHDDHILITYELQWTEEESQYAMVLLVADGINSKADLHDKRLCHPGYDTVMNDWTPVFANYLQDQLMRPKCEPSLTLLENRFAALSEWFSAACFPGVWAFSTNGTTDQQLKSKYSNLCALCDNGTCRTDNKDDGHLGAMKCLTEGAGDIAWVRLDKAADYLKKAGADTSKYKFMCPNFTTRDWKHWSDTCTWITKPWPVVIARREEAERVVKVIKSIVPFKRKWHLLFFQLVLQVHGFSTHPIKTETMMTPEDFLHQFPGLNSAYAKSTCKPSRIIKWCLTSSLEHEKCQWLQRAALSLGLEPEINCIQQPHRNASIELVASRFCDLYIVQPEDLMTAREKNLIVAMELIGSEPKQLNNIVMLVKNESQYLKIEDLQGATACFTKYRSVGWNAFVAVMSNRTNDSMWRSSDAEAMYTFFKSIVFPGADVADEEINNKTFDCLLSGNGDVAFVTLEEKYRNHQDIRKICVEDVPDSECILTWSTLASVMVRDNLPQVRRREIVQFLNQLNTWFGVYHPQPTEAMSLSSSYNTHSNLIFPELTDNLLENVSYPQLSRPYAGILEQLIREKIPLTATTIQPATTVLGATSGNTYAHWFILISISTIFVIILVIAISWIIRYFKRSSIQDETEMNVL